MLVDFELRVPLLVSHSSINGLPSGSIAERVEATNPAIETTEREPKAL